MADDLRGHIFEVEGWGHTGLVASERGLRALVLPRPSRDVALVAMQRESADVRLLDDDPFLSNVADQVRRYLHGSLQEFAVALDLRGHTSFALAVWAVTARIGYGQTRAYRWVADQVGASGGAGIYQATGAALGANPVPLVVPCHRVVGSDGALHGYAGGLEMKQRLLAMETGQGTLAFT